MKLISDWKRIWFRLWSVRLALLTALLSACEAAFAYWVDHSPWIAIGSFTLSIATAVSRIVSQDNLYDDYEHAP